MPNNDIEFNTENNLWWPKFEERQQKHYEYHTRHLPDLDYAISISNKRVCVQAGGNVGIWPNKLCNYYDKVISFEPDPALFKCMEKNVTSKKVECLEYALSDEPGTLAFYRTGKSGTGYTVKDNKGVVEPPEQPITVNAITLDSLNLEVCDAMFIDVEGFELPLLAGSLKTIARCKPVIQVELWLRCKEQVNAYLESINYKCVKYFGKDGIYITK